MSPLLVYLRAQIEVGHEKVFFGLFGEFVQHLLITEPGRMHISV